MTPEKVADWEREVSRLEQINKKRALTDMETRILERAIIRLKKGPQEAEWRRNNRDHVREQKRAYSKTPKGKAIRAAVHKRRYEADPEKFREKTLAWRLANPDHVKVKNEERKAAQQAARNLDAHVRSMEEKVAVWTAIAAERKLNKHEAMRFKFVKDAADPNGTVRARNKANKARYREQNREKCRAAEKAWREANPDYKEIKNAKRREARKAAEQ